MTRIKWGLATCTTVLASLASSAMAQTVVPVTAFSPTGWYTAYGNSGGGSSSLAYYTAIDSDGALRVQGDRTRTGFGNVFPTSTAGALGTLSGLTRASFQFAVASVGPSVPTAQAPAFRVVVWDPSSGTSGRRINITWEDGEQSTPQFVGNPTPVGSYNTAYTADLFGPGSRVYPFTAGLGRGLFDSSGVLIPGSDSAVSMSTLVAAFGPSASVMGFELGVGSSVGAFDGYADRVRVAFGPGNDNLYNFGVSPGAVSLNVASACTNSNTIQVTIDLNNASNLPIAGGQFFLAYDTSKLAYVGGSPSGAFSTEILDLSGAGTIDYACGIPFGGSPVTAASANFATLTFTKLADVCASDALTLVSFRSRPSPLPPTRLTNQLGAAMPTTTTNLAPFTMDSAAPVIACPPNITINANAGGCSGSLNFTNDFNSAPSLSPTQAPGVWYTDRYAPAGFTSGPVPGGTGLVHSISSADSAANRPPSFSSAFYNTQGRKYDVDMPAGFKLGIDLYVPGSWATDIRRADIWGTAFDAQNAVSGFPIIGFTSFNAADPDANAPSLPAQPRWRVWDSGNGVWIDLATPVTYNAWHRLEIELTATSFIYSLNNTVVATIPNDGSVRIGNTIVQAYNFGQSYDVSWDNLTYGPQGPVVTDNCDVGVSYVRSDNALLTLNDPFPTGTTNVTWTATDCSGNASNCVQTVTVNPTSVFNATVALSGVSSGTFDRCITFEFFGVSCPNPSTTVNSVLTFVNGVATASINVPCGSYTCITARDSRHTLRRTAALGISMGNYAATFTGADALPGGNLNDDIYVDILDFGGFAGQFGVNYGTANTTCSTPYPHADISGNGSVGTEDFTFIQGNFLQFNEPNCCGNFLMAAPNTPGGPVTDIAVAQLVTDQLWTSARGDLNRDGQLNEQDLAVFITRGVSTCTADFDNNGLVAVQDIFSYINSWFAGHPAADMDADQSLTVTDLFTFLNTWFRGC